MSSGPNPDVFELFERALATSPRERAAFLRAECPDEESRRRVEGMLQAHEGDGVLDHRSQAGVLLHGESPAEKLVGTRVGPYQLQSVLGEGGMGIVYAARQDAPLEREVALKIVRPGFDTAEFLRRFETEQQTLAQLEHPNICRIYDSGTTDDGFPYFAMERLGGDSLIEHSDRAKLSIEARLELFVEVCDALEHAHRNGILHRDLKPSNLLVSVVGGAVHPKVIDFGIAKALAAPGPGGLTRLGAWIGTPEYMSPEQADAVDEPADTRADVYSLGVVLYELLCGALPHPRDSFTDHDASEIRRILREVEPPSPLERLSTSAETLRDVAARRNVSTQELRRALGGELQWIVARAIAKEPAERYQSVAGLAADLRRYLRGEPLEAGPPGWAYRLRKFARRHRVAVGVAATITVLVLGFAVAMTVQSLRLQQALAETEAKRQESEAVLQFLTGLFEAGNPERGGDRDLRASEILARGAARAAEELENEPLVRAAVQQAIGWSSQSLGDFEAATPILEEALALRREAYGDRHPEVAVSLRQLGVVWALQDRLEEARQILEEALDQYDEFFGRESSEFASAAYSLATTLVRLGRPREAEELFVKVSEIQRREPASHYLVHPGFTLEQLAVIAHREGRYDEAAERYQAAIDAWGRDSGDVRSGVARANLGALLLDRGELDAAIENLQEALALKRQSFGSDHFRVAGSLNNLALAHHRLGDLERAGEHYAEALRINRVSYGDRHSTVATNLNNLGLLQYDQEDFDAAERSFNETLSIQIEAFGEEHEVLAYPLGNLAQVHRARGDEERAEELLRRALTLREARLEPQHPEIATTLTWLGALLADTGRAVEALPMLERALRIREAKLAAGDTRLAETQGELARCLLSVGPGRSDEARALLQQARETMTARNHLSPRDRARLQRIEEATSLL